VTFSSADRVEGFDGREQKPRRMTINSDPLGRLERRHDSPTWERVMEVVGSDGSVRGVARRQPARGVLTGAFRQVRVKPAVSTQSRHHLLFGTPLRPLAAMSKCGIGRLELRR
jgi:hypothetical protein